MQPLTLLLKRLYRTLGVCLPGECMPPLSLVNELKKKRIKLVKSAAKVAS